MDNLYIKKDITGQLQIKTVRDADIIGIIRQTDSEHFGNHHTSLFPKKLDGTLFEFNGWYLDEFYVNRQWYESYVLRLIVHKEGMPSMDLHETFRFKNNKQHHTYYNGKYSSTNEMYGYILRDCVEFLESLPKEIDTEKGAYLWNRLSSIASKVGLIDYYERYNKNRESLTEKELTILEKDFLLKLKLILNH